MKSKQLNNILTNMNIHVFAIVTTRFNNGDVKFNLGSNWSFLFNNQWYPTRAFMKAYFTELGEDSEYNLHQSVFELSKFIPIVSADIEYLNYLPVQN
jgi:hypothetical protein